MKIKNITLSFNMKDGGWISCECVKLKQGYRVAFSSKIMYKTNGIGSSIYSIYRNLKVCSPTSMKSLIEMDKEIAETLGYPEIQQKYIQRNEKREEFHNKFFNK